MPDDVKTAQKYDVGGVLYDRPFRVRRLGHFGLDNENYEDSLRFYREMFGFHISERIDFGGRFRDSKDSEGMGEMRGAFLRVVPDHHTIAFFPRKPRLKLGVARGEVTTNHLSFHVDTLQEVIDAHDWLIKAHDIKSHKKGRDALASNYHIYFRAPDGHVVEFSYGMEQIGWSGHGKPWTTTYRAMGLLPEGPQPSEEAEISQVLAKGIDIWAAERSVDPLPAKYNVGGILLARPFKVVRFSPVRLFAEDVSKAEDYYTRIIGLVRSEEVTYKGHRCVFLRCGTEHHSLALYPIALRAELGLRESSNLMSFGLQVSTYRQLRDARGWLTERGAQAIELPKELTPGTDYNFFVRDPDGHLVELYYYLEQVGWNGRVRTPSERRQVKLGVWPETLEPMPDTYVGQQSFAPF